MDATERLLLRGMDATELLRRQAADWGALPSPARCRAIRRNARATLEQVAAAVSELSGEHVTGAAVGHWERSFRSPSRRLLPAYLKVLLVLQRFEEPAT